MSEETKVIEIPTFDEIEFDEASHTYKLNGVKIPCVSDIMEPLKNAHYSGISEVTLRKAAERGTILHNAIENWIKFGIEDVPQEYEGYFKCFLDFMKEKNPKILGSEVRMYHKLLKYSGTADLIADINGEITLIDYKSTSVISDMNCSVQLEAYAQALASHGIRIARKGILPLRKDGKSQIVEYPAKDARSWNVFAALKTVYDYIHQF